MKRLIILFVVLILLFSLLGATSETSGAIKGVVRESMTRKKMSGVKIELINTSHVIVSDERGEFLLNNVPVGNYSLRFSVPDCRPIVKTDVIVRSRRITFVEKSLDLVPVVEEKVIVSASYFNSNKEKAASSVNFSFEELRRAPGSGGDISRVLTNLPSTAMVSDKDNGLAVRGGSPLENSFYIDNIQVPHINHFPNWGSSGGAIGLINVDFIQDVGFHCGGFSPIYGDRLSSVLDIQFREGNRQEGDWQIDMNMAGFGLIREGPLFNGKGSWLFSTRKSYLDLIIDAIGTGVAPRYSDFQGKVVVDLNAKNKLTLLGIMGFDTIKWDKEDALETGDPSYGEFNSDLYTFGANWFWMWNGKGYSNTSISYSRVKFNEEFHLTDTEALAYTNDSYDDAITLRNVNYFNFSHTHQLQFGFEYFHLFARHNYFTRSNYDTSGNHKPETIVDNRVESSKQALFFNYIVKPFNRLQFNLGVRADHFSYNQKFTLSPRISASWRLSNRTSIHASGGIFHQTLPLVMLYKNKDYKELKNPQAHHFILGIDHMLTDDTKLTLEVYDKEYFHFPMSVDQPLLFQCDEFVFQRSASGINEFVDNGRARSYGIEFTIQKKLASKIYGIVSASYFRTKYRDLTGTWRNRSFDNRYLFAIQGGYKPNRFWEFSAKWIYAGGAPFTPYDIEQSQAINEGVFDLSRINEDRYPAYHSLNVRLDKRLYFSGSSMTLFFSVWNAYNQKNIWFYYWNTLNKEVDKINQMSLLPILGVEFEF